MTEVRHDPRIDRGRDAVARRSWSEAYEILAGADRDGGLDPDLLPMLAEAAYFSGHPDISREAWERLHADSVRRGDSTKAAEAAVQILFLLLDAGLLEQFRGWSGRAERLWRGSPSRRCTECWPWSGRWYT